MEVKINRDIREYSEAIFFGMNLRQLAFSIAAILIAVGLYFGLIDLLGMEVTSWLCMAGAAPFAAMGFVKYHGMTFEQLVRAWFISELLMPEHLTFEGENIYYMILEPVIGKGDKRT